MAYEEHRCSKMPSSGAYISTEFEGFENREAWGLCFVREATEEDLANNHHLENVGDHIWSIVAEIAYCPYCGQKLGQSDRSELTEGMYLYVSSELKNGRFCPCVASALTKPITATAFPLRLRLHYKAAHVGGVMLALRLEFYFKNGGFLCSRQSSIKYYR